MHARVRAASLDMGSSYRGSVQPRAKPCSMRLGTTTHPVKPQKRSKTNIQGGYALRNQSWMQERALVGAQAKPLGALVSFGEVESGDVDNG